MLSWLADFWRDRTGRFAPLKAAAWVLACYPPVLIAVRFLAGDLGGRPINEATLVTGDWTIHFFLLSLAITPARALLDLPKLIPLRRIFGVAAACLIGLHLLLYCLDQKWNLWTVGSEIVLRFYLTIGVVALLGLGVLAITSTDAWQRRLRHRWKLLHRLVWPIGVLALWHYFLQSKINVVNPTFYTGLFYWLVFWRLLPRRWQAKFAALLPIALLAEIATAATEAAWYGLATRLDPWRVLAANLDVRFGLRPAEQVLVATLAIAAIVPLRRRWRQRGSLRRLSMVK